MRALLDECLDPGLSRLFARHECTSVKAMGWLGRSNGDLLSSAASEFDVFITIDRNLPYQQNLSKHELSIIVVREARNDPARAEELVMLVEALLDTAPASGVHWIDLPGPSG